MTKAARAQATYHDVIAFLSQPSAYGLSDQCVKVRETHMSWVFLTYDRVFKLKKPLKTVFLDYSTVDAREKFCREEVRLNRRLARAVYLRAVPVTQMEDGALAVNGKGQAIDWLVEMRRLAEERMLDRAIKDKTATEQDIDRALELLFAFFEVAAPVDVSPDRYLATLQVQNRENRIVLSDEKFAIPLNEALEAIEPVQEAIAVAPDWLLEPLHNRRIIEGHGDLRPEHICLTDPPVIIDCLEFNRDLRLVDPFDELCYLALECRLLGAAALADGVIERYAARAGEKPRRILLDFYTAYRAAIRARLSLGHIVDWPRGDPEKWTRQARHYLDAARAASVRLRRRQVQ